MIIHGLSKHPLYSVWVNMRARCCNEINPEYRNYGGRGIAMCKRWHDPQKFVDDMFPTFEKGLQIDRIDNAGFYEPSNCRWVTRSQNQRNKRNSRWVEYKGQKRLVIEVVVELNISPRALKYRVRQGIPLDAPKQDNRNRRNTVWMEFKGQRVPLLEVAERLNISRNLLRYRIRRGIPLDTPVGKCVERI